jgi:O-antigen ligase
LSAATAVHPADLEPSLISDQTYATRRFVRFDAAVLFVLMLCLLTLIPSQLIVPGGTEISRPALVVCMLMCFWWVATRLNPRLAMPGPQPLRWAVLLFLLSELVSYAVGAMRGLTPMESNSADRDILVTIAFIGVILIAADGLANWNRLLVVARAFVWCCVYMAVIGMSQVILPFNIVQYLEIPGLEMRVPLTPLELRGGGFRVPSTTTHFIELAATLAIALPFAIHFARFSATKAQKRRYAFAAVFLTAGVGATISRSGLIAIALGIIVLMPLWNWRLRYNVLMIGVTMLGGVAVVKPSLASTFYDIFAGASTDPSITSRTERYGLVAYYFDQRPWFGRGAGTWVSPMYQFLDNQWLDTALNNGLFGCAALAALHITAIVLASLAIKRATTPEDKHLCAALVAVQVAAIFIAVTFDAFSFTTYSMSLAVNIGLCGAAWRFTHPTRTIRTQMPRRHGQ